MKKNKRLQRLAVCLMAAAIPGLAVSAETENDDEMVELEPVVVTGSHIPTIQQEGPSPVTRITAEDIAARGFTTLDEALNSLTQITGVAQNETMAGTFTQNANGLELRDLGPGRTLVLVDGHRQAEYPMPYNGQSNFVNISAIPTAAIESVELLSSGASAIYGSDAVAGVVNVKLKKELDQPFSLDLRYGDTSQGGGRSVRGQLVTGFNFGRFSSLFAAEFLDRKPVYAFQRNFQDSALDNPDPDGRFPTRSVLQFDLWDEVYIDPGVNGCDAFPNLPYSFREGRGYYCGDPAGLAQHTLQNARTRASLFSRFSYELDNAEIYATVNLYGARDRYDPDYTWFTSDCLLDSTCAGAFFDVSASGIAADQNGFGGTYSTMQRLFQPYEIGSYKERQYLDHETVTDFTAGIRGNMGTTWRYDLTLAGSHYKHRESAPKLLTAPLVNYYLGEQVRDGSGNLMYDPLFDFYPVYAPDWDKLYQPITPETFNSFRAISKDRAWSDSKTATMVMNGAVLELPSGMLESAVVLEGAKQSYNITLDPRLVAGEYAGLTGTGGGGERKRYAAGLEFRVPVLDPLTLQLAGRYDQYDDITEVEDAFTYNVGLEFRPIRQLLVRGSYATSFRAPDMHYVFSDPSGYFTSVTDEYLCRVENGNVPPTPSNCTTLSGGTITGSRQGNPFLTEETGKSLTFGVVAQPLRDLTLSVDYYRITLKGGVQDNSEAQLLETEADCRLGMTVGGAPVDDSSLACQAAYEHVQRRGDDGTSQANHLISVITGPINASRLKTTGIDAALKYALSMGGLGRLDFSANFSQVLSYDFQEFSDDEVQDQLKNLQYFGWHSRMSGSATWTYGRLSTTAFVQRFGSIPNWAETGRLGSWATTNLSARYRGLLGGDAYVGFAVNNLFNRKPPRDPTFDTYPFYSDYNYDPIGREMFLEVGTRF